MRENNEHDKKEELSTFMTRANQVVIGLIALGLFFGLLKFLMGSATLLYENRDDIVEWGDRVLTNCEELEADLKLDNQCIVSDDCTMTREELGAYEERKKEYQQHCVELQQ